jgi:hypothetical protein
MMTTSGNNDSPATFFIEVVDKSTCLKARELALNIFNECTGFQVEFKILTGKQNIDEPPGYLRKKVSEADLGVLAETKSIYQCAAQYRHKLTANTYQQYDLNGPAGARDCLHPDVDDDCRSDDNSENPGSVAYTSCATWRTAPQLEQDVLEELKEAYRILIRHVPAVYSKPYSRWTLPTGALGWPEPAPDIQFDSLWKTWLCIETFNWLIQELGSNRNSIPAAIAFLKEQIRCIEIEESSTASQADKNSPGDSVITPPNFCKKLLLQILNGLIINADENGSPYGEEFCNEIISDTFEQFRTFNNTHPAYKRIHFPRQTILSAFLSSLKREIDFRKYRLDMEKNRGGRKTDILRTDLIRNLLSIRKGQAAQSVPANVLWEDAERPDEIVYNSLLCPSTDPFYQMEIKEKNIIKRLTGKAVASSFLNANELAYLLFAVGIPIAKMSYRKPNNHQNVDVVDRDPESYNKRISRIQRMVSDTIRKLKKEHSRNPTIGQVPWLQSRRW